MLRMHFTAEDIARVRVAAAPDPLWEITNSFQTMVANERHPAFGDWQRLSRSRLPAASRLLAGLLPPRGYSPDFLTPDPTGCSGLESAVDTVLSTSRTVLRDDMSRLALSPGRLQPLPAEARALAEAEPAALRRLGSALLAYHSHALAPYWPHIRAEVDADLTLRTRAVLEGGTDGLLASLRPVLRWRPPVLEAEYPVDRELHLDGRGLLLQPSFFCGRKPVTLANPELPPILVYPIQHSHGWLGRQLVGRRADELGALLGRTRAAILEDVATGRTTGELAERFGVSGAAASYHTAVLRRAGLLTSRRRGKTVLHTITPVGLAVLEGPPGPPDPLPDV